MISLRSKNGTLLFLVVCAIIAIILLVLIGPANILSTFKNGGSIFDKSFVPYTNDLNSKLLVNAMFSQDELKTYGEDGPTLDQIKTRAKEMKSLDIGGMDISKISTEIAKSFINLEEFILPYSRKITTIEGLLKDVPKSKLRKLSFGPLKETGNLFKLLNSLEKLSGLTFRSSKFTTSEDSFKTLLQKITYLSMENCALKASDLQNILSSGTKLVLLDLKDNDFLELSKDHLNTVPKTLKNLDLAGSRLKPEGLALLTGAFELDFLDIGGMNFQNSTLTGKIFGKSANTLTILGINDCELNGQIIDEINNDLINLKGLFIKGAQMRGETIKKENFKTFTDRLKGA